MSILVDLVKEDFGISGSGRWMRSDIHSSLVVDTEKDLYFFNSRELRGDSIHYLINIRGFKLGAAKEFVKRHVGNLPVDTRETSVQVRFEKLVELFHSAGKSDRDYWHRRLLTDSTIDRYRLGFFDGWSLIPIYDDGLFINFQCRRDEPEKKIKLWYKDKDFIPVLFNKDVLKFVDIIYITEGMVDCLLLNQLGFPSICSTNGADTWNSSWIQYFTNIKNIFYIADNDKAGIVGAKQAANGLGTERVRIFRFKENREKYGALDYFRDGGTIEGFKHILENNSVFGFEKELI